MPPLSPPKGEEMEKIEVKIVVYYFFEPNIKSFFNFIGSLS